MFGSKLSLNNYNYDLNKDLIANHPKDGRKNSNLLIYRKGKISQSKFKSIGDHLPKNTSIYFNDSKVINGRFIFSNRNNAKIEILILNEEIDFQLTKKKEVLTNGLIRNSKKWIDNETLSLKKNEDILYVKRIQDKIKFTWEKNKSWLEILDIFGEIPLPPYIKRKLEVSDYDNYQTVYSKNNGSIASPTAGLHFTNQMMNDLQKDFKLDFFTLHVGIGTFKPISEENIYNHTMHSEEINISKINISNIYEAENITAVGTTSLRILESIYYLSKMISKNKKKIIINQFIYADDNQIISRRRACDIVLNYMTKNNIQNIRFKTNIFILPGYKFKFTDQLITNFHYPKSTLILLISAFIGDDWRKVYKFALDKKFRFFSYGDSSLLYKQ